MLKKFSLSLASMMVVASLAACSSGVTPGSATLKGDANFADSNLVTRISGDVSQSKQDPSHFYIDAGNGLKTGASFTVKLNYANGGGFNTKASADGTSSQVFGNMTKLRVALIKNNTGVSPTSLAGALVLDGDAATSLPVDKTVASSGGTTTVTFTNVPENETDNADLAASNYWIAAAALDSGNTNITNVTGATLTDVTYGKFYVTNGGGQVDRMNTDTGYLGSADLFYNVLGTASMSGPAGSVKVGKRTIAAGNINYYVSSTTALTMSLKLRDAIGASVDSTVTVTDGTDRVSTVIGIN